MGVDSDWTGATLHQLEVIFEAHFMGFRTVAEGVFESSLDLTGCGKADDFNHAFLCERGEEKT